MKRKISILLILLVMITFVQCNQKSIGVNERKQITYKNKYIETEIMLPKEIFSIYDYKVDQDNISLISIDSNEKDGVIWVSNDKGENWNDVMRFSDKIDCLNSEYITAKLGKDGSIVVVTVNTLGWNYYLIKSNGEIEELNEYSEILQENNLYSLEYLGDSLFLGYDDKHSLVLFDKECGEVKYPIQNGVAIINYEYNNDILYVATGEGLKLIDLATCDEINNENISSNFNSILNKNTGFNMYDFSITKDSKGELNVVYGGKEGFIKISRDNQEGLLQGSKSTLGNSNFVILDVYAKNNEEIYVLFEGPDGEKRIFYYRYDENINEVSKKLNIFALSKNKFLEQAINVFQTKNRDIDINLIVATEEYPELSKDDIVKNLNMEIANGKCPDIMLLDGLNVTEYLNKDILIDLSEIIEEVEVTEPIYENIVTTFKKDEGLLAIPLKFSFMIGASKYNEFDTFNNFEQLIHQVKLVLKNTNDSSKQILTLNQAISIYYKSIFNETSDFTEENLKKFYSNLKELILLMENYEVQGENEECVHEIDLSYVRIMPCNFEDITLVLDDKMIVAMDYIDSLYSYCQLMRCVELDNDLNYSIIEIDRAKRYIPQSIIGISKNSSDINQAKDFLKFLISEEGQSSYDYMGGLAINKNSLNKSMDNVIEFEQTVVIDGQSEELIIDSFTEKEKEKFFSDISQISDYCTTDYKIETMIMEKADKILNGKITSDNAANEIFKKIQLYLNE